MNNLKRDQNLITAHAERWEWEQKAKQDEQKKNVLLVAIISRNVDLFANIMHLFGSLNSWTLLSASLSHIYTHIRTNFYTIFRLKYIIHIYSSIFVFQSINCILFGGIFRSNVFFSLYHGVQNKFLNYSS